MEYDFLGIYENEGQIEIHVKEGEKLWKNIYFGKK
jgi:hypothetical protein